VLALPLPVGLLAAVLVLPLLPPLQLPAPVALPSASKQLPRLCFLRAAARLLCVAVRSSAAGGASKTMGGLVGR
jgi:hypothetical protein